MKISKELEEKIDKAIEEYEKAKREGTMKFYEEEETMQMMFGDNYIEKTI